MEMKMIYRQGTKVAKGRREREILTDRDMEIEKKEFSRYEAQENAKIEYKFNAKVQKSPRVEEESMI